MIYKHCGWFHLLSSMRENKLRYLTQTNFPRLWLAFQYIVGGTTDKHRLAIERYKGQKKVLEIGCSAGIVSQVFLKYKNIEFAGIDIDDNVLAFARKRFESFRNFHFRNISLFELARTGEKFNYVLFAGILHHVDDNKALSLLKDVQLLLSDDATLIVMEPEKLSDDDGLLFRMFYKIERGEFRRNENELKDLICSAGLKIKHIAGVLSAPNALPFLKVGRITFIEATL
jgi:2-polyprenyl-3-methyl-5-hydroxy-6-metoxy-1,4-benzoquinol methylase